MPRNKTQALFAVLALFVIVAHLFYLWGVRTVVPHQDEWMLLSDMFKAIDAHRVTAWLFGSHNGHFVLPARLAYLLALNCFSLNLEPLRLLNFPICLGTFLLTAHVINLHIRQRFLRFYLYLGTCFVVFNLCVWEYFSQGGGFTAMLSALFGGIGLYYIASSTQPELNRGKNVALGIAWILASILSFGFGYPAVGAALGLLMIVTFKLYIPAHLKRALPYVAGSMLGALGLVAIASHPVFNLGPRIFANVFHFLLVAGSIGAFPFDAGEMALNAGYFFGLILFGLIMWTTYDFVLHQPARPRLLPVFSVGLVLFGLFGCGAVAAGRWMLPVGEFLSPRYTVCPSICLLGSLLYLAQARIFLLANVWCLVAIGYLLSSVKEQQVGRYRPAVYQAIENAMRNVDALSDEQLRSTMYFRENTEAIRRVAKRFRKDRLNIFHDKP
jgi:hypothetical protein